MGTDKNGVLYGLGVGPGDPELLSLKAARVLNSVDVVYAAASSKNSYSLAVSIAKAHIPDLTPIHMLKFPMTADEKERQAAWTDNARNVIDQVEAGRKVAFITLGDSMTYSTYGYLLREVQRLAPHLPVISIPGITSYQAAAAALNTPLVEAEESLLVLSGTAGGDHLRRCAVDPDTVVFLKAYRNVDDIVAALDEAGRIETSAGVTRCSLPDQQVTRDVREFIERRASYWTLILSKKPASHEPPQD